MSFSQEWDQRYRENTHMSLWPWSDVVSLVRRHCRQLGASTRVLELGCGAGANIPFFQALGVQYYAIEGSPSMVKRLQERFPDLGRGLVAGDFTRQLPFEPGFDLVIDRAAVTHNDTTAIEACLQQTWLAMKPAALFIGVDWFSTGYGEYLRGEATSDPYTRTGYQCGPFEGTGNVHFSDEAHLRGLFSRFELLFLEEKRVRRVEPGDGDQFASWNLVARKPNV
jgi:SAM-dependent methyltransferase